MDLECSIQHRRRDCRGAIFLRHINAGRLRPALDGSRFFTFEAFGARAELLAGPPVARDVAAEHVKAGVGRREIFGGVIFPPHWVAEKRPVPEVRTGQTSGDASKQAT